MARTETRPSGNLATWDETKDDTTWSGLLIGNGASQAVWQPFGYSSLFETAKTGDEIANPLTADDISLFDAMRTTNFEQVLESLAAAKLVGNALAHDVTHISSRYQSIQQALVESVHCKHVTHADVTPERLSMIREAIIPFEFIYSTNYDLLLYWAVMTEDGSGFKDFFWNKEFDLANTELWGKASKILYLHGGLHLYRTPSGATMKRRATGGRTLLDLFGTPMDDGMLAVPLFVAEGES